MSPSNERPGRPCIAFLGSLVFLGAVSSAIAQNVGSTEGALAQQVGINQQIVGALMQQIELLTNRVGELERKLEGPLTVNAPFSVRGPGGGTILVVDAEDGPELRLAGPGGKTFQVALRGDEAKVDLYAGGNSLVRFSAEPSGHSRLQVGVNDSAVVAETDPAGPSRLRTYVGDSNVEISANAEGTGRLRATGGGSHSVTVESTAETSGIQAGSGANDWVQLGFAADTGPRVWMHRGGKRAADLSSADDAFGLHIYDAQGSMATYANVDGVGIVKNGNRLATLNGDNGNGALELNDSTGAAAIVASLAPTGEPAILVGRNGDFSASMGVNGEGQGSFDVISGTTRLATLHADNGAGAMELNDSTGAAAIVASLAPTGEPAVTVGRNGDFSASMSVDGEGHGSFDVISDGTRLATLNGNDGTGALLLNDSGGSPAVEASIESGGEGLVRVGARGYFVAGMSADAEGFGSVDVFSGETLTTFASLNGRGGTGSVLLYDGDETLSAWLTALPGGRGTLDLFRGDQLAAQLGPGDRDETALRLFNAMSTPIAAIGGSPNNEGGALRILGANGETHVSLDSFDAGGAVNVFAAGGQRPVAALTVEAPRSSGVVAVYNNGTPIAFLNRSSGGDGGNVTTAMNDGSGVFSAGAAQDGAGEACVNRRGGDGTMRPTCLGIGLPLR